MSTPLAFLPKIRSRTLMDAARGQPCALRLPTVCNHNAETTVLAHLPGLSRGMGTKESDLHGAFACSACHDVADRRVKTTLGDALILDAMLRGLAETQARWLEMDLIHIAGGRRL